MPEGDSVIERFNTFNAMISLLLSLDLKITKEENHISLLCSFPHSWDSLVMDIGRNNTTLNINDVVSYLFSYDIR